MPSSKRDARPGRRPQLATFFWFFWIAHLLVALASSRSAVAEATTLPAVELPSSLTLDEALKIFRAHGLDLLIADAAVMSAEGDLKSAGAVPNPSWQLYGSYSFSATGQNRPSPPWGVTVGLGDSNAIEDSLSGKRGLRLQVARAALAATRQNRADAQRTIELQLKQQYILAVLARDSLDFALEVQKSLTQTFDLMHKRLMAGAISEADEAKVETAKLEADQAVDSSTQALRVAKLGLAFLLGVRGPVRDFQVAQDLPKYVLPSAVASATRESLIMEAFEARPDLRAMHFQQERAAASVRLAKRLRFPDLSLNLSYQQQAGDDSHAAQPPTFSVGVEGTLPIFYFQRGEITKAEADLRTQDLTRSKTEAQVVSDVETAWTNLQATRRLVERMEARLLDRASRARDLTEIQYKKGAASLLEFLDAQRQWIATNVEYLQDLANYWTAVFQLEQAVGRDLR